MTVAAKVMAEIASVMPPVIRIRFWIVPPLAKERTATTIRRTHVSASCNARSTPGKRWKLADRRNG